MANSIDTLLRSVGQVVYEVQITAETDGDTLLDTPELTTKDHRVYGIFRFGTEELFELVGTSTQGDAVFFTREQLTLTSQLKHLDVLYEIKEEIPIDPLHTGMGYAYVLFRKGRRQGAE